MPEPEPMAEAEGEPSESMPEAASTWTRLRRIVRGDVAAQQSPTEQ